MGSDRDVDDLVSDVVERIMSLWVLIEMLMIPNLMLLLFSEYCRENYEPVGSDRDVNDS